MTRDAAIAIVLAELDRAERRYPPFSSAQAAYRVIQKQTADWAEQLARGADGDVTHDLPQIAAAAIRALIDGGAV